MYILKTVKQSMKEENRKINFKKVLVLILLFFTKYCFVQNQYNNQVFNIDSVRQYFYYSADYGSYKLSSHGYFNKKTNSEYLIKSDLNLWLNNVSCVGKIDFFIEIDDVVDLINNNSILFESRELKFPQLDFIDSLISVEGEKYSYKITSDTSKVNAPLKGKVISLNKQNSGLYNVKIIYGGILSTIKNLDTVFVKECEIIEPGNLIGESISNIVVHKLFIYRYSDNIMNISQPSFEVNKYDVKFISF